MLIYAKFIYLNLCELMNDFLRLRDICGTKFESFAGHLRDIFIVRLKKEGSIPTTRDGVKSIVGQSTRFFIFEKQKNRLFFVKIACF